MKRTDLIFRKKPSLEILLSKVHRLSSREKIGRSLKTRQPGTKHGTSTILTSGKTLHMQKATQHV